MTNDWLTFSIDFEATYYYITSSVTLAEICFPSLAIEQKSEPKRYIESTKMQYSIQNARKQKKNIPEIPITRLQISVS